MQINNKNLLAVILSFLVIVDLLVGFNLNFLYIRAILSFLFIILVPGLLIMLCFKIRNIGFWEYLVYAIGLSISFIMFAGLAVNWILPWLHITDKPLSLWPILLSFNLFLLILAHIAYRRNKDLHLEHKFPKFDTINNIFFIIPMLFPVLAVLGAFILNNNGPNTLTMIMLAGIATYTIVLFLFRKKLNTNMWPWVILLIGLSLILSGWLRDWHIFGVDNSYEFSIFKASLNNNFLELNSHSDPYKAMLSLSIFPDTIYFFTNILPNTLFKILPILFTFIYLNSFLLYRRIFKGNVPFLASLFLISLTMISSGISIALRQGVAFLFFTLILLILFTSEISIALRKILLFIFGASMIVSHYSTTYIALAILIIVYLTTVAHRYYTNSKNKLSIGNTNQVLKKQYVLTGSVILLLLLFGFIWYNQLTPISEDLTSFAYKSASNLGNLFASDIQSGNGGIIQNIITFTNFQQPTQVLQNYINSTNTSNLLDSYSNANTFPVNLQSPYGGLNFDRTGLDLIYLKSYTEFFFRLAILPGLILFLFFSQKLLNLVKDDIHEIFLFKILSAVTTVAGIAFLITPYFSLSYGIERAYQQVILILAPFVVLGLLWVLSLIIRNIKVRLVIVAVLLALYFLIFHGFILALSHNPESPMMLTNYGREYNYYYSRTVDISAFEWLSKLESPISLKGASSSVMKQRYLLDAYPANIKIWNCIFPECITKKDYVLSAYVNSFYRVAIVGVKSNWLTINYPSDFLKENKNIIYSNGAAEIFK